MNNIKPRTKIVSAILASGSLAIAVLFTIVLPAEFSYDPLGTGETLGIFGLSEPSTFTPATGQLNSDQVEYTLEPYGSVEYKYHLQQGSTLLFEWQASNTVTSEFHGEPESGPQGYSDTYGIGKFTQRRGVFTAPTTGIHGWFWENRTSADVTVVLKTSGFYAKAYEFRDGFKNELLLSKDKQSDIGAVDRIEN
jgi:hypothetical protein